MMGHSVQINFRWGAQEYFGAHMWLRESSHFTAIGEPALCFQPGKYLQPLRMPFLLPAEYDTVKGFVHRRRMGGVACSESTHWRL
jgi:hypothetical protein